METKTKVMMACAIALGLGLMAEARTIEIKQLKSTGSKTNAEYWWQGTEKSKSSWFQIKIGGASQIDDTSEMEIRAATVFKSAKDKKTGINDVATFKFDPINKGKAIFFMVSTGAAFSRERDSSYWYADFKTGWQLAGCIIEIWQKGKVVRHWSNMSGKDGKTKLTDDIKKLRINRDGHPSAGERYYSARDFDNATEIYSVDQKGERVDIDEVLKPFRESENASKSVSKGNDAFVTQLSVKNTVAPKLRTCEFLLNKNFKKNAKFYLCLFSASWCGPCRREMPRIAKTYAETLKDDPDIELIHFSCDQNDEKAMAWAKEHDVKFPVVKPKGGNPLDLHSRGIPHLFIVKADGTLVEEGHPMRIFNEEKFREIKGGNYVASAKPQNEKSDMKAVTGEQTETIDGYTWTFRVRNGEAEIVCPKGSRWGNRTAVWPKPSGCLTIPSSLGGVRVTKIHKHSFADCKDITSVKIPASVKSVSWAFAQCDGLKSFAVDPDNPSFSSRGGLLCSKDGTTLVAGANGDVTIPSCVTHISCDAFFQCGGLTSVTIPSSVRSVEGKAFRDCKNLTTFSVDPQNPSFSSRDGLLCSKDGTILVAGVTGNVKIPSCVTKIGDGAFAGRIELASVEIPTSVKSIGRSAFFWCCKNLASVTIPASVTYVDPSAFTWCYKLSRIMIEGDNACYRSIDGVLYNKAGTELIICPEGKTDALTIPDGVTNVRGKFHRVTSVTIPASVKTINPRAFVDGCNLTSVTVLGERPGAEWKLIGKGGGRKLAAIHVPANAKSWAGMKEWQGIPLVFDAEAK